MSRKVLMCGNEIVGEAAIQAGCKCYFGYPITPQNELCAYMSRRMPEEGKVFLQSESELAAINMVFGASVVGERAMTSSSSPGISLKQEGISYLAGCELPAVVVNVMRGGPGLGNIAPSQADYFQATKGGGHGDYRIIVLAPATLQEVFDLTVQAFDLADKYRMPVMILSEGILGQMMEPVEMTVPPRSEALPPKDWALTGCKERNPRLIRSLLLKDGALEELNKKLQQKYREIEAHEIRYETHLIEDAELILVAYGTPARACKVAMHRCRQQGIRVGLVRPITLWPFPREVLHRCALHNAKRFLVIEMSAGQMKEDVELSVKGKAPVEFYGRMGGEIVTVDEIMNAIENITKTSSGTKPYETAA